MSPLSLYLLLLTAVAAGWLLGRFSGPRRLRIRRFRRSSRGRYGRGRTKETSAIFEDYFIGLNYLLNDEPDEAIDTFIKALEVNSETVETHLALGALLRRRGKTDKAIKVHQALLARPGLEPSFADSTRLQLALDYIAAGLLDRAERLLRELLNENSDAQWDALAHLITIYQTEKEWQQAIACATRLLEEPAYRKHSAVRGAAAHYCCEAAAEHIEAGEHGRARELVRQAQRFHRDSVRAALLQARLDAEAGRYRAAIKSLRELGSRHPDFLGQLLPLLRDYHARLGSEAEYESFLRTALGDRGGPEAALELANLLERRQGAAGAAAFLRQHLQQHNEPRALLALLRLQLQAGGVNGGVIKSAGGGSDLLLLSRLLESQLEGRPTCRCSHCGYESRNLNWLCPSCQSWDTITPIAGAVYAALKAV